MTARNHRVRFFLLVMAVPFVLACQYVERLIQVPEPKMETDPDKVLGVLQGDDWVRVQELAEETHTDEDYAKPGTLTFTVQVDNRKPVYFSYGWCAVDEETLRQNFEHIDVGMFLNGGELGVDVVHSFSYSVPTDRLTCLDFGVLFSEWPAGEYQLKAVATFNQKINDGLGDYDAGEYVFVYNITVDESASPAISP